MSDEPTGPKETAYDAHIAPLMTQIIALCKEHKINMAAQFALDHDAEGAPMYCTTCIDPDPADVAGDQQIQAVGKVMFTRPRPAFLAMTIITTKKEPSNP